MNSVPCEQLPAPTVVHAPAGDRCHWGPDYTGPSVRAGVWHGLSAQLCPARPPCARCELRHGRQRTLALVGWPRALPGHVSFPKTPCGRWIIVKSG